MMCKICSLNDYISKIQKITCEHPQKYVFRGQSNSTWPLSSSAARRIRKTLFKTKNWNFPVSQGLLLEYNRQIIDGYYLKGINRKNNGNLYELEILSELQHFGAATCLVDFSLNSLIALFFACISDNEKESDGAVFATNIFNCENYSPLQYNLLQEKIDFFLEQKPKNYRGPPELDEFISDDEGNEHRYNKEDTIIPPKIWFWEAPHINHRIPIQQSIFLFGKSDLEYDDLLIIPCSIKEALLIELNNNFNINEETLFPDFFGYSKNNEVYKDYKYWNFGTRLSAIYDC